MNKKEHWELDEEVPRSRVEERKAARWQIIVAFVALLVIVGMVGGTFVGMFI